MGTRTTILPLAIILVLGAVPIPGAVPVTGSQAPSAEAIRALISAGNYAEAEEASRVLVDRLEAESDSDPAALATGLDLLVESLWRNGRSKESEALEMAERAVDLKESTFGTVHPEVATSLKNLATLLVRRGDTERVQPLLERAVAIQEETLGAEHPDLIRTLNTLGGHFRDKGDFAAGEAAHLRALAIGEQGPGPESRPVAITLVNLAAVYDESGAYDKAISIHERSIATMETIHGGDHPEVASALSIYGNTLWRMGEYEDAVRLHRRALAIREKSLGPDHRTVAASLNNLALAMQAIGDLAGARPVLERAVEIWKEKLAPDHFLVAQGYNNLGTLAGRLGDFEVARRYLEQALVIREKRFGTVHPAVGQTLHNLGKVNLLVLDYARARPILQRAIDIWVETIGRENSFVALARMDLGRLLLDTGEIEAARAEFQTARAILEANFGPENVQYAESMSGLGEVERTLAEFERARDMQQRALSIRAAALGPDHPEVAYTMALLAAVDLDLGRFAESRDGATNAAILLQRHLRTTLGALTEREALILLGEQLKPEITLFSGLLADEANRDEWLRRCWEWTLGQRGLVLEEMAARSRAAHLGSSDEINAAWDHLTVARRFLAALWNRGVGDEGAETYRERLQRAGEEKERAEIALARVSGGDRESARAGRATLAGAGTALPDNSVLIEIVRVPIRRPASSEETPHDIALIMRSDGRTGYADLGPSHAVDDLVAEWRRTLHETSGISGGDEPRPAGTKEMLAAGARLRALVWEPLARRIEGAKTVFLVPDGSIHQLNLAALPEENGTFLMEDGPAIHLLSSARDLERLAGASSGKSASGHGVLALGAPDFDAPLADRLGGLEPTRVAMVYRGARTVCTPVTTIRWPRLPESAREVTRIESLFDDVEPVTALLGAGASEERLKLEAAGKRVLHLATHGYFLQGECASIMQENPLLLSGLVLAGANDDVATGQGGDDGILTAEEVAALDLEGVELAVLSACDTGRGEVAIGEGVYGLRRALELAGVRSIVMSLWPTPDREARRWMVNFYQATLSGASILEATRRASLANLEELREAGEPAHPYLWGGFVAAGDWR